MDRNKRNYGYGRRMDYACKQLLQEKYGNGHFGTVATHTRRFTQFAKFMKAEHGINDLRKVTPEHLVEYGKQLRESCKSVAYAQNLVSTVNVVKQYVENDWQKHSPRQLAGEARNNIRNEVPETLNRDIHHQAVEAMREQGMDRAAAIVDLARNIGVRSREATLANLARWQREADRYGKVNIQEGTKGGRTAPRWVPVNAHQREIIQQAANARPEGSKNLLNPNERHKSALTGWIREGRDFYRDSTGDRYHDARAAYACERYAQITGHAAPVVAGQRIAESTQDHDARKIIGQELGHNREEVVAEYIGGRS